MSVNALSYDRASTKASISESVAPLVTVSGSHDLDSHLRRDFGVTNLYEFMDKYANADVCIEEGTTGDQKVSRVPHGPFKLRFAPEMGELLDIPMDLPDIIQRKIENYLDQQAQTPDSSLQNDNLFKFFFESTINSLDVSFPLTMCNHPVVSFLGIDLSDRETTLSSAYEEARELLIRFKNLKKNKTNEITRNWRYININDILPVFVLCYNDNDQKSFENTCALAKQLKKQLFIESMLLPIWHTETEPHGMSPQGVVVLQSLLYEMKNNVVLPYMQRKIQFWTETIFNSRKSISKMFFKKFRSSSPANGQVNAQTLETAEEEFLLRKLADWNFMLGDFKNAFVVYDQLGKDYNAETLRLILPVNVDPQWLLSSSLLWCSISLFMGAQTILTNKMIKSDIDPLINRGISELIATSTVKGGIYEIDQIFVLILKFLVPLCELFLTLSDEWLGVPYAIRWYEEILYWSNGKYSLIECFIWERLSYCFKLRVDPRVAHHVRSLNDEKRKSLIESSSSSSAVPINPNKLNWGSTFVMQGHQRERKAFFFELLAAKKWLECHQIHQATRLLLEIEENYKNLPFANREDLLLYKLKRETGCFNA